LGVAGMVLTAVVYIGYVQYQEKHQLDKRKIQIEEEQRSEQKGR